MSFITFIIYAQMNGIHRYFFRKLGGVNYFMLRDGSSIWWKVVLELFEILDFLQTFSKKLRLPLDLPLLFHYSLLVKLFL